MAAKRRGFNLTLGGFGGAAAASTDQPAPDVPLSPTANEVPASSGPSLSLPARNNDAEPAWPVTNTGTLILDDIALNKTGFVVMEDLPSGGQNRSSEAAYRESVYNGTVVPGPSGAYTPSASGRLTKSSIAPVTRGEPAVSVPLGSPTSFHRTGSGKITTDDPRTFFSDDSTVSIDVPVDDDSQDFGASGGGNSSAVYIGTDVDALTNSMQGMGINASTSSAASTVSSPAPAPLSINTSNAAHQRAGRPTLSIDSTPGGLATSGSVGAVPPLVSPIVPPQTPGSKPVSPAFANGARPDPRLLQVQLKDLETLNELGFGAGGHVQQVIHRPTGVQLALKTIDLQVMSPEIQKQILTELRTLNRASHPNVVTFYSAFFSDQKVSIALEFMDLGSLADLLAMTGPMPSYHLGKMVGQMLRGLDYLHRQLKLVHRDIKPSNILMNLQGEVKLADFGVSTSLDSTVAEGTSWVGTMVYMAPERIEGHPHSFSSDIWSLGLVVYELLTGSYAYEVGDVNFFDLLNDITKDAAPSLDPSKYDADVCDFVKVALAKNALHRPSAAQLLSHPWIVKSEAANPDIKTWVNEWVSKKGGATTTSAPAGAAVAVPAPGAMAQVPLGMSADVPILSPPGGKSGPSSPSQGTSGGTGAHHPDRTA